MQDSCVGAVAQDQFGVCVMPAVSSVSKSKKRKTTKPSRPLSPFRPQKTAFQPPHACWEVVLANPHTAHILSKWRWLWLLPQVSSAFRAGLQQEIWLRSMCKLDIEPLIWKAKANELFALTPNDFQHARCFVVCTRSYRETHLMYRTTVLQLAFKKHGDSFRALNDAFLKRQEAKRKRRAKQAAENEIKRMRLEETKSARQRELDAMLAAEGIPVGGFYYSDCIEGKAVINMSEFRFRHYIATTGVREYDKIIEQLRRENDDRFYSGIHADAREILHDRLVQRGISFL